MIWIEEHWTFNGSKERSIGTEQKTLKLRRSSGRGASLTRRRKRLKKRCKNWLNLKKSVTDRHGNEETS
jgi:hypothetical protein